MVFFNHATHGKVIRYKILKGNYLHAISRLKSILMAKFADRTEGAAGKLTVTVVYFHAGMWGRGLG